MLIFNEGLEFSLSFWTAAFQTNCEKLAEPRTLHEKTDKKEKENKEERLKLIALLAG